MKAFFYAKEKLPFFKGSSLVFNFELFYKAIPEFRFTSCATIGANTH